MRFSLETIAESLETDTEDSRCGSTTDLLAEHVPSALWKLIRRTDSVLGLTATSCCLASKRRPDLNDQLSRMKLSIRRKQASLRLAVLSSPDAEICSRNTKALEFTCDFMERMCQRLMSRLCSGQLETLTRDTAGELANVVEDVGLLSFKIDDRQPMDDVMLSEMVDTFIEMSLALPHFGMEKFSRHFVHELYSKFDGDGAWMILSANSSSEQSDLDFSIWNLKDCYLWLCVDGRRSYVIMQGLPGRKTDQSPSQTDMDLLLKDVVQQASDQQCDGAQSELARKQFEAVYSGRWHCVKGHVGDYFLSSSRRLRYEARITVDDQQFIVWQW